MHLISIIDNDKDCVQQLQAQLHQANFMTEYMNDGQHALENLNLEAQTAILMDISLPGLNGFELCKAIRKNSSVPILFISEQSDEIDRLLAFEYGADDFICKPFSPREVVAKIKAIIRRSYPQEIDKGKKRQVM